MKYLRSLAQKKCIFCEGKRKKSACRVVFKTEHSLCMLNIFPYNNGHCLIAPLRHVADITQLKDAEALDLLKAVGNAKKLLQKTLKPHGYNIGINISGHAGAGIPGHLHVHIVPRWKGDTNFMPVVFDTKVVSQSLEELHTQLTHAYARSL